MKLPPTSHLQTLPCVSPAVPHVSPAAADASLRQLLLFPANDALDIWTLWTSPRGVCSVAHTQITPAETPAKSPAWTQLTAEDDAGCLLRNADWLADRRNWDTPDQMDPYYRHLLGPAGMVSRVAVRDAIAPFSDPLEWVTRQMESFPRDESLLERRNACWLELLRRALHLDGHVFGLFPCSLRGNAMDGFPRVSQSMVIVSRWYRTGAFRPMEPLERLDYVDLQDETVALVVEMANQILQSWRERGDAVYGRVEDWNCVPTMKLPKTEVDLSPLWTLQKDTLFSAIQQILQEMEIPHIDVETPKSSHFLVGVSLASLTLNQVSRQVYTLYHRALPLFHLIQVIGSRDTQTDPILQQFGDRCVDLLSVLFPAFFDT